MNLTVNGKEVFAATGGREFDKSLPAVVLIHGAGFDHSAWALHSRWFAHHGFAVLVPDLPGHGRSKGPALKTIAEMADWTAALLDAAGATKAHLIGHSMGSLIALETAARHPAKVSALGLIGTAATMTVGPDLLKAAEANDHDAIDMVLDLGPRLRRRDRRQPRAGDVDAWRRAARAAALRARRAVLRPLRLQFVSGRARGRREGHRADDADPRREGHDDPGQGRQGAGLGDSAGAHRGVARARAT